VAGDLGVGGRFLERGDQELAGFHVRQAPGRRKGEMEVGRGVAARFEGISLGKAQRLAVCGHFASRMPGGIMTAVQKSEVDYA
jgi:hypothetical protein